MRNPFRRKAQDDSAFKHIKITHHKIGGVNFRCIEEPNEMPRLRMCGYYLALFDLGRKASTGDLFAFVDACKQAINKNQIADLGFYVNALEANLTLYTSFYPLFDMATCMILLDGEPMKEVPQKFNDEKLRLCKTNEDIKAFFFARPMTSLQSFNKDLDLSQAVTFLESKEHQITTETFLDAIDHLNGRTSPTDLIMKHYG